MAYPALMETAMNTFSVATFKQARYAKELERKQKKFAELQYPIIYHPRYNMTACGVERLHPFDSQKFGRAYDFLIEKGILSKDTKIHQPNHITRALLFEVLFFLFESFLSTISKGPLSKVSS